MIKELLGKHDRERPNELRVGSRNRPVDAPVKLYFEDRVTEAETTAAFARAQDQARVRQDSAQQAAETRKARNAEAVRQYIEAYTPSITPHPDAAGMTQQELWSHHLGDYYQAPISHSMPNGLSKKERRDADNALYTKHRAAVYAAYGWENNQ
nr:hypothetical protein [Deinococcus arboris]